MKTQHHSPAPKTLRVMQVHTFYHRYLHSLYRKRHGLAQASFDAQTRALIQDAFSGIHMLAPYLPGCEAMLVVANCAESQNAWLGEHGQTLADKADWVHEVVRRQIACFQPDVLYLSDSLQFAGGFIASLPYRPRCIVGWRGADVPFHTDWTGFDVMLSGLPRLLALAESLGAKKGVLFHPGMPSWIARAVETIPQDIDVVFAGSISPAQHVGRLALLQTLAAAALHHNFSLALHLLCDDAHITPVMRPFTRPPVFGLDMHRALRRGRIVIDDRAHHGVIMPDGSKKMDIGGDDTINMRMFEAAGGGSLLLTEALPGVARYFEPGREVVTYADHKDAADKILYYLARPEQREAIAAAGKARCLTEHNMNARAGAFMDIARANLPMEAYPC